MTLSILLLFVFSSSGEIKYMPLFYLIITLFKFASTKDAKRVKSARIECCKNPFSGTHNFLTRTVDFREHTVLANRKRKRIN